ncbi:MAG: hypothetical protein Q9191_004892 [Dirinaria sp. TL-2023a]
MATTPPLQLTVHTPPTPLHGAKYDSYHRYQTRRTTRRSSQRAAQTPPAQSPEPPAQSQPSSKSRKVSATRSAAYTYSPPSSTQTSPQKKLFNTTKSHKRAGPDAMVGKAFDLKLNEGNGTMQQPGVDIGANMLPTPAKTPKKKQVQPSAAVSRVLFPVRPDTVDEAMPTPRKANRNRRHAGFTLDSSMDDETNSEGGIKIYTDTKEKVPELDQSEDNPFIDHPVKHDPPKAPRKAKSSSGRKAKTQTADKDEIHEAFNHEEGMVYVFRGRKIYKRFPSDSSPPSHQITSNRPDLDDHEPSSPHFTRSSIKPRLLFPTAQQQRERQLADEEATTDIEPTNDDCEMSDSTIDETAAAQPNNKDPNTNPVETTITGASPAAAAATGHHATRSATKKTEMDRSSSSLQVDNEAGLPVKRGRKSPFDGWARRKAGSSSRNHAALLQKGTKRAGESMEKGDDSDGGVPVAGSSSSGNKKVKGGA